MFQAAELLSKLHQGSYRLVVTSAAQGPVTRQRVSPSGLLEMLGGVEVEETRPAAPDLHCRTPPLSVMEVPPIQTRSWRAQVFADGGGPKGTGCGGMSRIRPQTPSFPHRPTHFKESTRIQVEIWFRADRNGPGSTPEAGTIKTTCPPTDPG